jgi:Rad3-related DNA helicase
MAELALHYPILSRRDRRRDRSSWNQFRATPHAVLFATSSFWQGVDVVGEALSCVIVDKIPFASPGDPITAARIEQIRARGGDPFGEYQVPLAILALQQGLGRLIRHRRDRGVLAVLDRGCGRWATAAASSRRCRRRRSSTIWNESRSSSDSQANRGYGGNRDHRRNGGAETSRAGDER